MLTTPDPLTLHYYELCDTRHIPDMPLFVSAWYALADDFEKQARPAMAAMCRSRGEFYSRETGTEYVRIVEGHIAELLEVA